MAEDLCRHSHPSVGRDSSISIRPMAKDSNKLSYPSVKKDSEGGISIRPTPRIT